MLSTYCEEIAAKYEIKVGDVKTLIPNFGNKIIMQFMTEISAVFVFGSETKIRKC